MSDRSHINWGRLASYLSGDLPPLEREDVERWIAERDEHRAIMGQLRAAWTVIQPVQLTALDIAELQRQVMRQIGAGTQASRTARRKEGMVFGRPLRWGVLKGQPLQRRTFKGQPLRWGVWSAAVALGVGLVILVVSWTTGMHRSSRLIAQSNLTYTTGNGERATITLPDGGTVALNVASRLDVPVDYMTGNHTVRLVGEGLFTVPHHEGALFTVLTGATAMRVLGTSFVVRRYATDTATLVAVRDGKVAVGTAVVTADHMMEIGSIGVPQVQPSDTSLFTFATGVLTIDGLSLPAAIPELNRWYDADIRLGSPTLATHKLRGEFTAGSLSDLDEFLQFTLGVRVVRAGRILTLFPKL